MKVHTDYLWFNTKRRQESIDITDDVVKEVELALKAHELIKVRAPGIERVDREEAMRTLCERTRAQAVQTIGKVFVMYRKRDE